MKKLMFCIVALSLNACSSNYSFNSNLDKENFDNYLPGSKVSLYTQSQVDDLEHEYLGVIEGVSCQLSDKDAQPQEVDARNDAREQAALMGANGLVIKQCYTIVEPQNCVAMLSCFSSAYRIVQP